MGEELLFSFVSKIQVGRLGLSIWTGLTWTNAVEMIILCLGSACLSRRHIVSSLEQEEIRITYPVPNCRMMSRTI